MSKTRRTYSKDFKLEATKKVICDGMKIVDVAKQRDMPKQTLGNWVRAYKDKGESEDLFRGSGNLIKVDKRVKELESQNRHLEMQCNILKNLIQEWPMRSEDKYLWIKGYETEGYEVSLLCTALDVSRNSYYKWKKENNEIKKAEIEKVKSNIQNSITKTLQQRCSIRGDEMFNHRFYSEGERKLLPHRIYKGDIHVIVIPKIYEIPFNLFDLEDKTFSKKNPYRVTSSGSTFIKVFKEEVSKHKKIVKYFKDKYNYVIKDPNTINQEDKSFFNKFAKPLVITRYTQKVSYPWDKRWVERQIDYSLEGNVEKSMAYRIYELAKDLKEVTKDVKKKYLLTEPKESSVCLFYDFPCNIKNDDIRRNDDSSRYLDNLKYMSCNGDTLGKIMAVCKKNLEDDNVDFFTCTLRYSNEHSYRKALYKTREYHKCNEQQNVIEKMAPFFEKELSRKIDTSYYIKKKSYQHLSDTCVYKFRVYLEEVMIHEFNQHLDKISDYISYDIFWKHDKLIQEINPRIYEDLYTKFREII